jgi:hypothetical protein
MKLDPRYFSQQAYSEIVDLKDKLDPSDYDKAASLVQGLVAYISTWGLHRLSGDAKKFGRGDNVEDTSYKAIVYLQFLEALQTFSQIHFTPNDPGSLIGGSDHTGNLKPRDYLALDRLAIRLAREWSFWAPAVLEAPQIPPTVTE